MQATELQVSMKISNRTFTCDKRKNRAATTRPEAVICVSPCFRPRRYSALIMYADTRQFNARILYTCMTAKQRVQCNVGITMQGLEP